MGKKFFISSILGSIIILLILGLVVFYTDPWQQFRYNNKYYNGDQRILNIGLAKNYKYKTAVIGTSTSENFLKEDVDVYFKTNSVNLSIAGATALEQRNLLEVIINNKNVENIIYGLDFFSYNRLEKRIEQTDYTKFRNVHKYLFNINVLRDTAKIIIQKLLNKNDEDWIYKKHFWGDKFKYSEESTLSFNLKTQSGRQNLGILKEIKLGYNYEIMKENFDEFLKMVDKNKNINYIIYLPPYSVLYWYELEKYDSLKEILKFKKYIYDKTKNLKNILIYDFQDREDIISNLNNYKDSVHYGYFINKKIIEELKIIKEKNYDCDFDKNIKKLIEKNEEKFKNINI